MLRTTNPTAAGVKPENDRRVPYLGETVLFHLRTGEGQLGRLCEPAIVTQVEDNDHVELVVVGDPVRRVANVGRRSAQNPVNSWSPLERPDVEAAEKPDGYPTWEEMYRAFCRHRDELADTVEELRAELSAFQKNQRKH